MAFILSHGNKKKMIFKILSISFLVYTLIRMILPKKRKHIETNRKNKSNDTIETIDIDYEEMD